MRREPSTSAPRGPAERASLGPSNPEELEAHSFEALDRALGSLRRRDPEEALAIWQAIGSGRWSLVDQFDSDGRRYVLAHRNDPRVPGVRGLTLRERQVSSYADLGHPNKVIAYELGISISTVATHLRRARAKRTLRSGAALRG